MWQSPMGLEKEKIMGVMIPGFGWTWHRNQNKLVLRRRSLFCPVILEVIEPRTVYILLSHFLRVTVVTSIFLWRWYIANDALLGGNGTRQCNWNQRTWEGPMFSQFGKSLVWMFCVSGSMIVHLAEDSIWVLEKPNLRSNDGSQGVRCRVDKFWQLLDYTNQNPHNRTQNVTY